MKAAIAFLFVETYVYILIIFSYILVILTFLFNDFDINIETKYLSILRLEDVKVRSLE